MNPAPATSALLTSSETGNLGSSCGSAISRGFVFSALGQLHRQIGREVAMCRVARPLEMDPAVIVLGRDDGNACRNSPATVLGDRQPVAE